MSLSKVLSQVHMTPLNLVFSFLLIMTEENEKWQIKESTCIKETKKLRWNLNIELYGYIGSYLVSKISTY